MKPGLHETQDISLIRSEDQDIPSLEAERIPRWAFVLVPVLAAVVACPGLGNHLLSDDYALLYGNVGQSASDLISPFFHQSTSRAAGGTYRPLTEASIGLDYLVWGAAPFGYHLVNLLFHVLNSLLCYGLVRVMVPPRPVVALTAGLLFAVHPVHGDAIFWLSARSDLLCTFFYILSMILYVRGRGPDRRRMPTVGSVFCFILALLAKEVALSLPFLVVLLDLAAPSVAGFGSRFRRHLPRYLVYFGVAFAYLGLRLTVLPTIGQARFPTLSEALFHFFLYLKLLVLPMETHTGPRGLVVVGLGLIVLLVSFLRYARMGDRRNLFLALGWMVTILFPMLDVPRRWQLYLPSVGFCIFCAIVMAGLVWRRDQHHPRWLSRISGAGLLLLLVGGGLLLYIHASVYSRAGQLSMSLVDNIKRLLPKPAAGQVITAANLPGVLTSWGGDQPIFAFGFNEALKLAYGRSDLSGRLLTTLYVRDRDRAAPRFLREGRGEGLLCASGQGAYAFSLHTRQVTTGRDRPQQGTELTYPDYRLVIESVEKDGNISAIRILPRRSLAPIFYWDGTRIQVMK